jgi:hypothetical protein
LRISAAVVIIVFPFLWKRQEPGHDPGSRVNCQLI